MLIACPECGHHVSDAAPTCPACGYPIRGADPLQQLAAAREAPRRRPVKRRSGLNRLIFLLIIAGLAFLLLLYKVSRPESEPDPAMMGLAILLVQVLFWGVVIAFVIWIIRRGVALGVEDSKRGRR